jgi:hypothetical protein
MQASDRGARAREFGGGWLALVLAATGCDEGIRFADAIDLESDFRADDDGELHTPYAIGATVRVYAEGPGMAGATLESSDPTVLDLVADPEAHRGRIGADAHAVGPGVAELRVVTRDGETIASTDVEVRAPSRAVLHAAAPQFVERDDLAVVSATPSVIALGSALFEVQLFDGATRLHGSGGLSASADAAVDVRVLATFHGETREWLQVSPNAVGNHEVRLAAAGESFATTVIAAVDAVAIADVRLHGEADDAAGDGEWVPLVAQAYGHDHQPIHGVAFAWELAGETRGGGGELWRYQVDRDQQQRLSVRFGDHAVDAMIHAAEP